MQRVASDHMHRFVNERDLSLAKLTASDRIGPYASVSTPTDLVCSKITIVADKKKKVALSDLGQNAHENVDTICR